MKMPSLLDLLLGTRRPWVIVNGRKVRAPRGYLSYYDVIGMAGGAGDGLLVRYRRHRGSLNRHRLFPGDEVEVDGPLIFDVYSM